MTTGLKGRNIPARGTAPGPVDTKKGSPFDRRGDACIALISSLCRRRFFAAKRRGNIAWGAAITSSSVGAMPASPLSRPRHRATLRSSLGSEAGQTKLSGPPPRMALRRGKRRTYANACRFFLSKCAWNQRGDYTSGGVYKESDSCDWALKSMCRFILFDANALRSYLQKLLPQCPVWLLCFRLPTVRSSRSTRNHKAVPC